MQLTLWQIDELSAGQKAFTAACQRAADEVARRRS